MKKSLIITALALVFLAGNAFAGGKGAVKVDFDPNVGFVNLNTTASGMLIAAVHIDSGLPNDDYSVTVRVRYEDGSKDIFNDIATLTTNGQGRGNVQVQVDINPPAGSNTLRRIAVRVEKANDPVYLAIAWDIPLK